MLSYDLEPRGANTQSNSKYVGWDINLGGANVESTGIRIFEKVNLIHKNGWNGVI